MDTQIDMPKAVKKQRGGARLGGGYPKGLERGKIRYEKKTISNVPLPIVPAIQSMIDQWKILFETNFEKDVILKKMKESLDGK